MAAFEVFTPWMPASAGMTRLLRQFPFVDPLKNSVDSQVSEFVRCKHLKKRIPQGDSSRSPSETEFLRNYIANTPLHNSAKIIGLVDELRRRACETAVALLRSITPDRLIDNIAIIWYSARMF
jgi:hypothetical protein